MSLEIFDDNRPFTQALEQALDKEINAYLVNINLKKAEDSFRSNNEGLEVAAELDPSLKPIILYSVLPEKYFMTNTTFQSLIGKGRVGFIQLPFTIAEFKTLYQQLLRKQVNAVAVELGRLDNRDKVMAQLRHDLPKVLGIDATKVAHLITSAREKAGLTGTDEEILQQIQKYERLPTKGCFANRYWPGVFCDIEGTLLVGGKINQKTFEILEKFANEGKPVTLWTGGNLELARKQLLQNGIIWKLVSKYDFEKAYVEIVIDDEPQNKFEEKYQIKAEAFIKIS